MDNCKYLQTTIILKFEKRFAELKNIFNEALSKSDNIGDI